MLLVLGQQDEVILQVAGDAVSFLGFHGAVQGRTLAQVLGVSLASLLSTHGTLRREPAYIGEVDAAPGGAALSVTAHLVNGLVVVELEHAARMRTAPSLATISSITGRIVEAPTLLEATSIAADEVRAITGYDRVMVYQFLADESGSVIAESRAGHLSPYLQHRFPASDIPAQARELYRRSAIRVIPNVGYVAAPLVPVHSSRRRIAGHESLRAAKCVAGACEISQEHGGRCVDVRFAAGTGRTVGPDRLPQPDTLARALRDAGTVQARGADPDAEDSGAVRSK